MRLEDPELRKDDDAHKDDPINSLTSYLETLEWRLLLCREVERAHCWSFLARYLALCWCLAHRSGRLLADRLFSEFVFAAIVFFAGVLRAAGAFVGVFLAVVFLVVAISAPI